MNSTYIRMQGATIKETVLIYLDCVLCPLREKTVSFRRIHHGRIHRFPTWDKQFSNLCWYVETSKFWTILKTLENLTII